MHGGNKALADTDSAKLQDYSCAALRKHLPKDADKVVRLEGVQMLTAAMEHREYYIIASSCLILLCIEIAHMIAHFYNTQILNGQ